MLKSTNLSLISLVALCASLAPTVGCSSAIDEESLLSDESSETIGSASLAIATYDDDEDWVLANDFRPRINLRSSHQCFPLTFKETAFDSDYVDDWTVDTSDLQDFCRGSFSDNFVVAANVVRDATRSQTFRITYGIPFGMQYSHLDSTGTLYFMGVVDDEIGSHGEDAQYIVVDVVDGKLTSVWADLHKGNYVVPKDWLNLTGNHVNVYPGKYYNSLKLYNWTVSATDVACDTDYSKSDLYCVFSYTDGNILDYFMNFGDPVGTDHQGYGKLVMADEACDGTSYTSPDGITYSGNSLTALRGYIGCDGESTTHVWSGSYMMQKSAYTSPYSLAGCKSGDLTGGDICNASVDSASDTWTTFSGTDLYMEPDVAGMIRLESESGTGFNDMISVATTTRPSSISLRTGSRVDKVSVTYTDGTITSHGGTGGDASSISGLSTDPVISVKLCDATKSGDTRAGYIKLTTLSGRTLEGGEGSSNCETIAPSGKQLYGFYGRSGTELDVLGTYWGSIYPTASDVSISVTDTTATGSYTFGAAGSTTDASTFTWQRSATGSTTDASTVGTSSSYTLSASDNQQYLRFCVTPVNDWATGTQSCSDWTSVGHIVSFYEHNQSGGSSKHFAYEKSSWGNCVNMTSHAFNDKVSSLTFRTPTTKTATVWLYKDVNCAGPVVTYTVPAGQISSVGSMTSQWGSVWNDALSSFKVTW